MFSDGFDPFDRIPKVELHCHVEASVRPATVLDLAAKAGRPLEGRVRGKVVVAP